MYKFILILTIILLTSILLSQDVQEEWINTIQNQYSVDIKLDEYNNVYVLTLNYSLIKYDSNGDELWNVTYEDSTGGETAVDFAIDDDNNIYVTGHKNGIDSWSDIVTVKYDSNGNHLWDIVYQSPSWADVSESVGLAIDSSNNVYITGFSYYSTESTGYSRCVTIKYNSNGDEEWISIYEPVYDNWVQPSAIVVDNSGLVYITGGDGTKSGQIINYNNFVTISYDTDGLMQWDVFYYGNQYGWATGKDISLDLDNNVIITGDCWEPEGHEIVTIKYNNNGNLIWDSHLVTQSYSFTPDHIAIDSGNNSIVTCNGFHEYQIVKYDQSGNELWVVNTIKPEDLAIDQEDNIYVTGYFDIFGNYDYDYSTVKYTPEGTQEWLIQYNGVDDYSDYSKAIALDNSGNVYISGKCYSQNFDVSCVTIKYSQTTSVNQGTYVILENRLSNYPNPFNPSTTISFSIQSNSNIELSVFNTKGQITKTLANNTFTKGSHSVIWNGEDNNNKQVSSGVYYYKLSINGKIESMKKCLLLK
jgi:hypothetical protein